MVKLPLALLVLEKIERLHLDLDHSIEIGSYEACKYNAFVNLGKKHKITFRQLLEELLIVSDNLHYNTLFHFLTPLEINKSLREKGFMNSFIYKSFEGCDMDQQLNCAEVLVKNPAGSLVYLQKASKMDTLIMLKDFKYSENRLVGQKKYENRKIVRKPIDFNYSNDLSLANIHRMIESIFEPSDSLYSWSIQQEHKEFIQSCLQKFPREMTSSYHENYTEIPDHKFKYFLIGESADSLQSLRTFSKIAYSYGFTSETAYLPVDENKGLFLSMAIYTNANGILNDGKYEYEEVARPVFNRISTLIYEAFNK